MKILLYNMGYGTGINGSLKHYLLKGWRYLWFPKWVIQKIIELLKAQRADIVCLLEAATGSFRSRFRSQIFQMARALGFPFYSSLCKYGKQSICSRLPVFRKHHTGIMGGVPGAITNHYLKTGMKRLVKEVVVEGKSVFIVHLSRLRACSRQKQLRELTLLLKNCPRPYLVCGDFNIRGFSEIESFLAQNQLRFIQNGPSFPSAKPQKCLDLFLASRGIEVKKAGVVRSELSDHLPVWVEI